MDAHHGNDIQEKVASSQLRILESFSLAKKVRKRRKRLKTTNQYASCNKCFQIFKRISFKSHVVKCKGFKNFKCDLCLVTSSSRSFMAAHIEADHPHRLKCEECGVEYKSYAERIVHLKDEKKCLLCSVEFPCGTVLQKHSEERHRNMYGFLICPHPECSKLYKRIDFLLKHLENTHKLVNKTQNTNNPKKEHQCSFCAYKAQFKSVLKVHMRKHLKFKEKKTKCNDQKNKKT